MKVVSNKNTVIRLISQAFDVSLKEATRMYEIVIAALYTCILNGGVMLHPIGKIYLSRCKAKKGYDMWRKQEITIPAKHAVKIRISKRLRKDIYQKHDLYSDSDMQ